MKTKQQGFQSRVVLDFFELENPDVSIFPIEYRDCLHDQFRCLSNHCIDKAFVCDGDKDCQDASDELNCTTRYPNGRFCPANKFQCDNSVRCRPRSFCGGEGWIGTFLDLAL